MFFRFENVKFGFSPCFTPRGVISRKKISKIFTWVLPPLWCSSFLDPLFSRILDVPIDKLKQLVAAFDDLREMADNSLLSYPYSTRELVNIVKHLQLFPDDSLVLAIRNVFDFDAYSSNDVLESIYEVFQKHGIPLGKSTNSLM